MTGDDPEIAMLLRLSERALRIYQLDAREVLIVHAVLDWSFRRQKFEALIPELRYFTRITGVEETDARKILTRLCDRGILQVKELGLDSRRRKLRSYRFRPEAAWWRDAPLRVDLDDSITAEQELAQMADAGRDVEPDMQVRLFPAVDDDLEDGLTVASRDSVLKDAAANAGAQVQVAAGRQPDAQVEVPAARRVDGHFVGGVVFSSGDARKRGDGKFGQKFRDSQKQAAWVRVEQLCACPAWEDYRYWWVGKVSKLPIDLITSALSDTEFYIRNNRCDEQPGALLWRRILEVASDMGIRHPALERKQPNAIKTIAPPP